MRKHHQKKIGIYKSNGRIETFSKQKLRRSIERSGLSKHKSKEIADSVSSAVYEGDKTKDIFKKTYRILNQISPVVTVNYSLKKAIFDLGPEGHYFETYVARYFEEVGHEVLTCKSFQGQFVKHEVDVIAAINNQRFFIECKFHNHQGIKNDVKISLYVKARWDDLKGGVEGKNLAGYYVASNTAFTLDAITYANGTGLKLLGVNSPPEYSFFEQIKKLKLFPLTSLRSLNRYQKRELLKSNLVLAKEIPKNKSLLYKLGITERTMQSLLDEVQILKGEKS